MRAGGAKPGAKAPMHAEACATKKADVELAIRVITAMQEHLGKAIEGEASWRRRLAMQRLHREADEAVRRLRGAAGLPVTP